ncbi:steroidogenic acute regulatory protein-like isoform X2 [Cylas formicarius]|uniref:steroidogenic acute regulatory protein-like isoform X2 n=1 Tax=Cylas formicarius TaxID=197179 RepID=UPI002958C262|nr:steroidogenic acute regulatory protein-like isoform X2 [Cylas formicarius]
MSTDYNAGNFPSYQNENVPSALQISHSHSINTISSIRDCIVSEDLLAGQRLDGRMSNVRRFFCLFVTFDVLFISLMWLICIMLKGQNIMNALEQQIVHYNIRTSLFDIVLVALGRFLVLVFFYALLYINHWIIISLSTSFSCAFLIGKVFMYDWPHSSQPVFEVLLVLASFILSWGEAWFLDFRVIPQETHASRYLITSTESERAPLIRSYVQGLPSMCTESVGNFYSPLGTPEGSLYRNEAMHVTYPSVKLTGEQEEGYQSRAAMAFQNAWDLVQESDWKLERQQGQDKVFTRNVPKVGKIFKLEAEVDASSKFLLEELYYKVQDFPKWNPAIKESHKIQIIDEHTDICYQISTNGAGGLVSSRDFVNLRRWGHIEDCYIIAFMKTEHPSLPVNSKFTRGETGVGCYLMQDVSKKPAKCRFCWVLNTNLKIKIPKFVLEKEFAGMMFTFLKDLRHHISNSTELE